MGCDIHMYVEVWNKEFSVWEKVGSIFTNLNGEPTDQPYANRNYDLFYILSPDCGRGGGFKPLRSKCAGIPEDVSPAVGLIVDAWDVDAHSHSWFTLAELLAYPWEDSTGKRIGVVNEEEYKTYLRDGKPEFYSGGVGGGGVKMVNKKTMHGIVTGKIKRDKKKSYYTRIKWNESVMSACGDFIETIEELKKLGKPEEVRIIFWFDN